MSLSACRNCTHIDPHEFYDAQWHCTRFGCWCEANAETVTVPLISKETAKAERAWIMTDEQIAEATEFYVGLSTMLETLNDPSFALVTREVRTRMQQLVDAMNHRHTR